MPKKKYKIASLFSGCGGLDLGFTGGSNLSLHNITGLEQY